MTHGAIRLALLHGTRERCTIVNFGELQRFAKRSEWEAGETHVALKKLRASACAVHAPAGYTFLPIPPNKLLPIPNFRANNGRRIRRASFRSAVGLSRAAKLVSQIHFDRASARSGLRRERDQFILRSSL